MEITKQDVEKVAKLARLALTEAETTAFSQQLNQIVAYVQKLKSFSTEGVEPTSTVPGQSNVFRPDPVPARSSTTWVGRGHSTCPQLSVQITPLAIPRPAVWH